MLHSICTITTTQKSRSSMLCERAYSNTFLHIGIHFVCLLFFIPLCCDLSVLMEFQFFAKHFRFWSLLPPIFSISIETCSFVWSEGRFIDVTFCDRVKIGQYEEEEEEKQTTIQIYTLNVFGVNFAWNVSFVFVFVSLCRNFIRMTVYLLRCKRVLMFQVWRNYPSTLYRGREYFYDPQMTKYGHIIGFTIDFVSRIMYANSHSVDCEWAKTCYLFVVVVIFFFLISFASPFKINTSK